MDEIPPVKEYQVTWLTLLLHSFPHLDLGLQRVNSTFNLENVKYKESLIVWAAVPVLWLLLTLMVFLLYFCYRCCQQDVEKSRRLPCLRWTMVFFAFVSCCSIGVGFYGNEDAQRGIQHLVEAADDAVYTVMRMKNQSIELQRNINETVAKGIEGMRSVYSAHPELNRDLRTDLHAYTDLAFKYTRDIFLHVFDINRKAGGVDLSSFVHYTKEYGFYRWIGTLLALGWLMFLCLLLLLGIGRSSKCLLLLFCAFGIFSLVLCWLSAGLHLLTSVGAADFCASPHAFFEGLTSEQIERDIIAYYIKCDINIVSNPFKDALQHASDNVKEANSSLNKALSIAQNFIPLSELHPSVQSVYEGLGRTIETLMHLTALVECTNLHKDYVSALDGICNMTLPGVVFLLLSVASTGMFFAILVILASRAWRHFGTNSYSESDDEAIIVGVNAKSTQNVSKSLKNLTNNKILGNLLKGDKILDVRQLQRTINLLSRAPRKRT